MGQLAVRTRWQRLTVVADQAGGQDRAEARLTC
jgi:hypothetical protein